MPVVGTTYTIGVIREKEKFFLTDSDYTRLIEAPTTAEAVHVLVDTPYGTWMNGDSKQNVFEALMSHLQEELMWIIDLVENRAIARFITARYNALDIVNALYDLKTGQERISYTSPLSKLTEEGLFSALWHNKSWDHLPTEWIEWTKEAKRLLPQDGWSMQSLLESAEEHMLKVMEDNAVTDLTKEILTLKKAQLNFDKTVRNKLRGEEKPTDIDRALHNYRHLTSDEVNQVQNQVSATAYEKGWDEELMAILQKYRLKPMGYDPIISYWYGKELEARQLRLLLSAKLGGVENETLQTLKRSPYTTL